MTLERAAVKDAIQFLANGLLVGFTPVIERNCRHAPTPNAPGKRQPRKDRGQFHTVTYYDRRPSPVTLPRRWSGTPRSPDHREPSKLWEERRC
jgi:hypothetical protein